MKEGASLKLKLASFAVLVLTLVFVTLSLVFQFYFSEKKMDFWVQDFITRHQTRYNQEHPSQKLSLDFEKVHLSFLASFNYPVGLRIKGLSFRSQSSCEILKGDVETVVIPINLFQAFKKKTHLGLIRFSDGLFKKQNLCETPAAKGKKSTASQTRDQRIKKIMDKFLETVHKKEITSFFSFNTENFKCLGFVLYDLKAMVREGLGLELRRFKFLFGSGEVKGKGTWNAKLQLDEEKVDLAGEIKVLEGHVSLDANLMDKESLVQFEAQASRLEKTAHGNLEIHDLPLSRLSHLSKASIKGLNLRRVWVDLKLDFNLSSHEAQFEVTHFKSRGDFGQVSTGREPFYVFWSEENQKWKQREDLEIKVEGLALSEVFEELPQKKLEGVFGRLGDLNAYFRLQDLNALGGEFEILGPSVLFRSMGKVSAQKIKHIRGDLKFQAKNTLDVLFHDVQFVDGDFDGEVFLSYDYRAREVKTKFNLQHVKLAPEIVKEIFSLQALENLSLKGEGTANKTKLLKKKGEGAVLNFDFQVKTLGEKHWEFQDLSGACAFQAPETYKCRWAADKMEISEDLKKALGLEQAAFVSIKNAHLVFSQKSLKVVVPLSSKSSLSLDWSSQKGTSVQVKSLGLSPQTVYLRGL